MAHHRLLVGVILTALGAAGTVSAETLTVEPTALVEWKAVYGQIETRDRVPARARIGGTVEELAVTEGDRVEAGQRIARVTDDKLQFQLDSIDARLESLNAQLATATSELERGQSLFDSGALAPQRLDQLRTAVDVVDGQIRSLQSERLVVERQIEEGDVLAPETGVVLDVPLARGSVVVPGETVAVIAGGQVYLRLSVPERHAGDLAEGAEIEIGTGGVDADERATGRLVKLYPLIEGGRVQADVEVDGLDGRFVGRRVPVRLPVGERAAILVPEAALQRRGGLDFVTVETEGGEGRQRAVVPGGTTLRDGEIWREVLTGLSAGDRVVVSDE